MASKRKCSSSVENVEESDEISILDLPDLALDCILKKLEPAGLCNMACVCSSSREKCTSDYTWERHMRERWGKIVGQAAQRQWEWYLSSRNDSLSDGVEGSRRSKRWIGSSSCVWPLSWLKSRIACRSKGRNSLLDDSIMSWYLSLESGKFWFPAQVYNREHGPVGFMLSCYDAELSYDCRMDTFQARYPPHGRRTVVLEDGVEWDRVRPSPVDACAHDLHVSDCLHDLRPGTHIEIQWRRNKEFPYDTVVLEFNQYAPGSRWRQATVNGKGHPEEGSETDGFYGGIRKLHAKDEISAWKQLWPVEVLE